MTAKCGAIGYCAVQCVPGIFLTKFYKFIPVLTTKAAKWPHLSYVAQHLLAAPTPAASTSSERLFSLAGLTLSDRRSNLSGDSVDGLLFIHGLK